MRMKPLNPPPRQEFTKGQIAKIAKEEAEILRLWGQIKDNLNEDLSNFWTEGVIKRVVQLGSIHGPLEVVIRILQEEHEKEIKFLKVGLIRYSDHDRVVQYLSEEIRKLGEKIMILKAIEEKIKNIPKEGSPQKAYEQMNDYIGVVIKKINESVGNAGAKKGLKTGISYKPIGGKRKSIMSAIRELLLGASFKEMNEPDELPIKNDISVRNLIEGFSFNVGQMSQSNLEDIKIKKIVSNGNRDQYLGVLFFVCSEVKLVLHSSANNGRVWTDSKQFRIFISALFNQFDQIRKAAKPGEKIKNNEDLSPFIEGTKIGYGRVIISLSNEQGKEIMRGTESLLYAELGEGMISRKIWIETNPSVGRRLIFERYYLKVIPKENKNADVSGVFFARVIVNVESGSSNVEIKKQDIDEDEKKFWLRMSGQVDSNQGRQNRAGSPLGD